MRISDWSSDVCSSDLRRDRGGGLCGCGTGPQALDPDREDFAPRPAYPPGIQRRSAGDRAGRPDHDSDTRNARRGHADRRRDPVFRTGRASELRSEEHTAELQSLMRTSSADFHLNTKTKQSYIALANLSNP